MSEMKNIINMIETVSLSDVMKLREIDARITCLLYTIPKGGVYEEFRFMGLIDRGDCGPGSGYKFYFKCSTAWRNEDKEGFSDHNLCMRYTLSLGSIKGITPKNWTTSLISLADGRGVCVMSKETFTTRQFDAPSPELAWLHAVLQAIAHEHNMTI